MKTICPKCFALLSEGQPHADWCDDIVEKLKELFGFDKPEKND